MSKVVLYHTQGCHLCEQAYQLLLECGAVTHIEQLDIINDQQLIAQYQTSIPVVMVQSSKAKLYWPFTLDDIQTLLAP